MQGQGTRPEEARGSLLGRREPTRLAPGAPHVCPPGPAASAWTSGSPTWLWDRLRHKMCILPVFNINKSCN